MMHGCNYFGISIHAPREGSDLASPCLPLLTSHFYPRSPQEERPGAGVYQQAGAAISIHAPRKRSDIHAVLLSFAKMYFYPRSPQEERP